MEQDQFSQEFRWLGGGENYRWIAGIFYFNQSQDNVVPLTLGEDTPVALGIGPIPGYVERADTFALIDSESAAVFASAEWSLGENWTLAAGVRYTTEEKDIVYEQTNGVFEAAPGVPINIIGLFAPPVAEFSDSLSDDAVSGDISLTYHVSDEANIYGKISRGFKAGGFDATFASTPDRGDIRFDSEFLLNYELGAKSTLADGRVRLNAAAFFSDYTDKQETQFNGVAFTTSNAAEAEIYGLEMDIAAAVSSFFTLNAAVGLQSAEFVDYADPVAGFDYSGNKIGNVPEATAQLAATFENEFGNGWGWLFRVDADFTKGGESIDSNDPTRVIDDRTHVNGRIAFSSPNRDYEIAAWVKNAFDEMSITGFDDNVVLGRWVAFNNPRTWGVEFRANFGASR